MITRFRGIAKEVWEESVKEGNYEPDFREVKYLVVTINGVIEIINPYVTCENRTFDDKSIKVGRDNNYLRFVMNHDEIIDIPKEQILYVKKTYGDFICCDKISK